MSRGSESGKPSEVFEQGGLQLRRGDVLQLLPGLQAESVDAVITDPPYCSGGTTATARKGDPAEKYCHSGNTLGRPSFVGDTRDQRSFAYWCTTWLTLARQVSKPEAYCLVFIDWRQLPAMTDALQAAGWTWRGVAAWNKGRGARAPHKGYMRHQCEYIVWGTNGAIPILQDRGPFDGCFDVPVKQSDKFHMTGKPTQLLRELVQVAPVGGTVLDPFSGSATTGVAAALEGRKFIGFEATSEYFEIGRERLQAASEGNQLSRAPRCR
ncbi:DNA-methyltransferase [Planctomicrobium sp. SH661]|uniref:DNA-methyltransferase n=1 Tax=Planctomicrobium sp. SH661 TaxID=3448124 RepID=UPI003F5BEABC